MSRENLIKIMAKGRFRHVVNKLWPEALIFLRLI